MIAGNKSPGLFSSLTSSVLTTGGAYLIGLILFMILAGWVLASAFDDFKLPITSDLFDCSLSEANYDGKLCLISLFLRKT